MILKSKQKWCKSKKKSIWHIIKTNATGIWWLLGWFNPWDIWCRAGICLKRLYKSSM